MNCLKDAKAILQGLKGIPIHYLHVAAEHFGWEKKCMYASGESLTGLAKAILSLPVIANGKLQELALAQQLLDTEQADFIAIGKTAISNPDFVSRLMNKQALRPRDISSLHVNPSLFSEEQYQLRQATLQEIAVY